MIKHELVELTNQLYKATLLFPKKEPLRYKIRELADEILADFVSLELFQAENKDLILAIERDLEIILAYLEIAKWQNWISYFDLLEIQEKYAKIKDGLKQGISGWEEAESLKIEFPAALEPKKLNRDRVSVHGSRKEKILGILKEKGQVQVWQVKEVLASVSKRTLRRDFEKLLKQGLIERIGERNETFYKLKSQEI